MNSIASLLVAAAEPVNDYGKKLLQDITPEMFARKPVVNGKVIEINHPAFQFGHLGLYPNRFSLLAGMPTDDIKPPEGFMDMFKVGSPCHDDPEGKIYPSMQVITDHFFKSFEIFLARVKELPDEVFFRKNSDERSSAKHPIVGSFLIYLLTAHSNTHFGQVSAWRRCMGLKGVA